MLKDENEMGDKINAQICIVVRRDFTKTYVQIMNDRDKEAFKTIKYIHIEEYLTTL